MTSTEVDKSGASYYGKQSLHYLNTKGDTAMVMLSKSKNWNIIFFQSLKFGTSRLLCKKYNNRDLFLLLGKEGPVHAVEWSPKNTEFCVVYGFMPAKATLFNAKCEAVFEFGTLHRNSVYFNPHGNNILFYYTFITHQYIFHH